MNVHELAKEVLYLYSHSRGDANYFQSYLEPILRKALAEARSEGMNDGIDSVRE